MSDRKENQTPEDELHRLAESADGGLIAEYWYFLRHYKKWYLLPILVLLLIVGFVIFVGGSSLGPFIYTLF